MTLDIFLLLVILTVALIFFSFEWLPSEVVGLGVLLAVILCGLLPSEKAFAGFGSGTVLMILGLLIMTSALLRTGVVDLVGRSILQRVGTDPDKVTAAVMGASAGLSCAMSNTATTAFFLPITMRVAARAKISPSGILMPLAFSSILASSVTLIATSTNIVVSGLMVQKGLAPLGMFELTPVGIPILIVGLLYMYFVGRRLIRARHDPSEDAPAYGLGSYLTEIVVLPESRLIGKTLEESGLGHDLDITVVSVHRAGDRAVQPRASLKLKAGDVLLVEGSLDEVLKVKDVVGIDIKPDVDLPGHDVAEHEVRIVEAILLTRSPLVGRTLKSEDFRKRYGLQVLGINREGQTLRRKLADVRLRMGDVLLLQGPDAALEPLEQSDRFRILGTVERQRPNTRRASTAVAIFVLAFALPSLNLLSLPVAALLGALAVFLTRCITPQEAYREVEWAAIILIGSMLALGAAMEATGTARYVASHMIGLLGDADPLWMLAAIFVLVVALTQPMSNQAAAAVVLPVAVQLALDMGLNPRTFCAMIAVAASCSYLTPLEPSCLMVYGPGRYRFRDFLRVGAALTVVIFAVAMLLVPRIWPLGAR